MKQKHLASLLQTGYTTVNVAYHNQLQRPSTAPELPQGPWAAAAEPNPRRAKSAVPEEQPWNRNDNNRVDLEGMHTYVYKMRLEDKPTAGDTVVVMARNAMVIGVIVSVDPAPRIDSTAEFDYRWVVQKLDLTNYNALVEQEQQFVDSLMEVERAMQRQRVLAEYQNSLPAESVARSLFDKAVTRLTLGNGQTVVFESPVQAGAVGGTFGEPMQEGMQCK